MTQPLPYGTLDLDPDVHVVPGSPRRVRCYVRGCQQVLRTPTRIASGDVCPEHGIRCHLSRNGPTYSYAEPHRNIIASPELFRTRLVGHPFKFETDRFGLENSEDALTWNVFRSLQEAGCLHQVAHRITGQDIQAEPYLFLWGICLTGDTFEPWDLLIAARERFESNLPVKRPLTEPDIALYLPGHYLILIEAKFTSPNPFYTDGPRKDARSLTKAELLDTYQSRELYFLDVERARNSDRVYYQLWRNMVFAEWMARQHGIQNHAFIANLTRRGTETAACESFRRLLQMNYGGQFVHLSWEDVCRSTGPAGWLDSYITTKTSDIRKAFSQEASVPEES